MIKYVIFDFDGTVADSKELAFDLLNELSDKYDFRNCHSLSFIEKGETRLYSRLPC
jgi:phosphoglycolate phosphatase